MRVPRWALAALLVLAAQLGAIPGDAGAATPAVHFDVFAKTGLRLADVVWTGRQFLYVENTTSRIVAAGSTGMPFTPFAQLPRQVEETRCRVSPGAHGFPAGDIYCHAPDNKIYRISGDGTSATVLATLPQVARSDGALAFDLGGSFGYALVAASGRSGGGKVRGGVVFAIDATGHVRRIGAYDNAGGADELVVAPTSFGSASGQVLLPVDAGKSGALVAMDAHGRARTLLTLPDGPNPIAVLGSGPTPPAGAAQPGLYVTDTLSRNVFFAPAGALAAFRGDVVIGSELGGLFWVIRPNGNEFTAIKLATNLNAKHYNLEGAAYISG
jgi:hypothetical protein